MPDRRPTFDTVANGYHPGQVGRFVDAVIEGSAVLDRAAHARAAELVSQAESEAAEILESARYLKELATQEVENLVRRVHAIAKREAAQILEDARAEAASIVTGARRSMATPSAVDPPTVRTKSLGAGLQNQEIGRVDSGGDDTSRVEPTTGVEDLVLDALMHRRRAGVPKLNPNDDDTIHRYLAG